MDRIPVLMDTFASYSEVEVIDSALADLGYEAQVERIVRPQGAGPWLVLIAIPAGQFLAGFVGKAGEDAWEAFKRFFQKVRDSHEPRRRFWKRRAEPRTGELVIKPDIETAGDMDPDKRAAVMMG